MAQKVRPIRPTEVVSKRKASIPDVVFETFNEMIAQDFNGTFAYVYQDDIVKSLVEKGFKRDDIFKNHWLDVEEIYRKQGWEVKYDSPAYCESYHAHFIFTAKSHS